MIPRMVNDSIVLFLNSLDEDNGITNSMWFWVVGLMAPIFDLFVGISYMYYKFFDVIMDAVILGDGFTLQHAENMLMLHVKTQLRYWNGILGMLDDAHPAQAPNRLARVSGIEAIRLLTIPNIEMTDNIKLLSAAEKDTLSTIDRTKYDAYQQLLSCPVSLDDLSEDGDANLPIVILVKQKWNMGWQNIPGHVWMFKKQSLIDWIDHRDVDSPVTNPLNRDAILDRSGTSKYAVYELLDMDLIPSYLPDLKNMILEIRMLITQPNHAGTYNFFNNSQRPPTIIQDSAFSFLNSNA